MSKGNDNKELFLRHLAQTSPSPIGLEIEKAEGIYLYTKDKKYIDLISGISVSSIGHGNKEVINAIKEQAEKHLHTMVYGEFILSPQVELSALLASLLPKQLSSTYFVNSGSEAIEGAMKLAKRYTGRPEIISFKGAYHGSSHGALSLIGEESFKQAYRPLLPGIKQLRFNDLKAIDEISKSTAAVVIELIQGEAGVIKGERNFINALSIKCRENNTLLVVDEIQTGCGRTGSFFAFEQYGIVPDVLVLAKALGGGMPIGAFISSKEIMNVLSNNPVLGHITTFGGHPVSCAAALANLNFIINHKLFETVSEKEKLFKELIKHTSIIDFRSAGLLMAIEFKNEETNMAIIQKCIDKGVLTDWFLFNSSSMRIAPPLTITDEEIRTCCNIINECIVEVCGEA